MGNFPSARASCASIQFRAMPPSPPPAWNRKSRRDRLIGTCVFMLSEYSRSQWGARTWRSDGIFWQLKSVPQSGVCHVVGRTGCSRFGGVAVPRVRAELLPQVLANANSIDARGSDEISRG